MDTHSVSYEIVYAIMAQVHTDDVPAIIHIDPIALEVQRILEREMANEQQITRINQDDNDW